MYGAKECSSLIARYYKSDWIKHRLQSHFFLSESLEKEQISKNHMHCIFNANRTSMVSNFLVSSMHKRALGQKQTYKEVAAPKKPSNLISAYTWLLFSILVILSPREQFPKSKYSIFRCSSSKDSHIEHGRNSDRIQSLSPQAFPTNLLFNSSPYPRTVPRHHILFLTGCIYLLGCPPYVVVARWAR